MKRFKKILVGIDLSNTDRIVADELAAPTRAAIDRATWLAKLNTAEITFMTVLPPSLQPDTDEQYLFRPEYLECIGRDVLEAAEKRLQEVVDEVRSENVRASYNVSFGPTWMELVRNVLSEEQELVIVGSRNLHGVTQAIGSTGRKLLRKCPCPVWVTKPQDEMKLSSILVATDFSQASHTAMQLAASMAKIQNAQLHVLHAVEYSVNRTFLLRHVPDERLNEYEAASTRLDEEMKPPKLKGLRIPPIRHLQSDKPVDAILKAVELQKVQLLVMGTVGRSGIKGFFVGNTADCVLSDVPCSVLAVKSREFVCPISLDKVEEPEMTPEEFVPIFTTHDANLAELLKTELQGEGIACQIDNENQAGFAGILDISLLVPAVDADRATKFLNQHETTRT